MQYPESLCMAVRSLNIARNELLLVLCDVPDVDVKRHGHRLKRAKNELNEALYAVFKIRESL